jgi:hypothetical protein
MPAIPIISRCLQLQMPRTKSTIRKALFLDMRLSELMWNEPDRANDPYHAVDRRLGNRVVEFLASISQQPTQAPHRQSTIFRTAFSFSITSVATDVIRQAFAGITASSNRAGNPYAGSRAVSFSGSRAARNGFNYFG